MASAPISEKWAQARSLPAGLSYMEVMKSSKYFLSNLGELSLRLITTENTAVMADRADSSQVSMRTF